MRFSSLVVAAIVGGLLAPLPFGLRAANAEGKAMRKDIIPVKDIKPGMKGYGLTVFEGTKPEKFEVEVIDVLTNFQPRQELILIKTKHPRLEVVKVVGGMSGSPIYLNGKMAGAYAYGWTFGVEPVAGVTPIRNMLDDLERPLPKMINGWPLKPLGKQPDKKQAKGSVNDTNRFAGAPSGYDLKAHADQIAKFRAGRVGGPGVSAKPVSTPLLMGGMTGTSVQMAKELLGPMGFEPMQAGGGGGVEKGAPKRYVDGGAVGVQLIRGDMSAMGLGTVTRVEGDKLLGFGHPMMSAGVTAIPAAVGRVLWFMASQMRSFKIGMPVRPVGALVNDRLASIVVSHSARAPVIPVKMKITGVPGAPYKEWDFEIAHEKFMAPVFAAVSLGNAMQATASERQDVSWTANSKLYIKGHGTIELEDFGVAVGGTPSPRDFIQSNLVQAMGMLMNNPWEPLIVERAEMQIELRYAREVMRLRGAELLDSEVEAGQPARVRVTLIPYDGKAVTRTVRVPLPKHLAGRTVSIAINPGYRVEKEKAPPDKLEDVISNLEDPIYPAKSLVFSYVDSGSGVAYKGHVARNLPPGALDMLQPTSSSLAPTSFASRTRHVVKLPEYVTGGDVVQVKVKPILK